MAIELWQIAAAPVNNPAIMTYYGPYADLKEARQAIEGMFPSGNWVTGRRYYTKVENDAPWD
jgi:hypothetical protein